MRRRGCPFPWGLVAWLVFAPVLLACMWDHDTLAMERSRFPSALELITGKFLRHSPEFYQWRIRNRLKRLESEPNNLALLDDLSVAYDKTGQHDLAIETAHKAGKLQPGRYETEANLGTFLIHSGKLEEGLVHIDKALRINPDAHFGREKYQKALVEYVLERRKANGPALPLSVQGDKVDFGKFLAKGRNSGHLSVEENRDAIRGILGMMRFGKHDAPVLLEALGSLLSPPYNHDELMGDAKQLAARAYLLASYELPDRGAQMAYRDLAQNTLSMQTDGNTLDAVQMTLGDLESVFKGELAQANAWYSDLRDKEAGWIRDGQDPEAEFQKLYDQDPQVDTYAHPKHRNSPYLALEKLVFTVVIAVPISLVAWIIYRLIRRRRKGIQPV